MFDTRFGLLETKRPLIHRRSIPWTDGVRRPPRVRLWRYRPEGCELARTKPSASVKARSIVPQSRFSGLSLGQW